MNANNWIYEAFYKDLKDLLPTDYGVKREKTHQGFTNFQKRPDVEFNWYADIQRI